MSAWVLVANSSKAYLYYSDNLRIGDLSLLNKFSHPESRKKVSELVSDRPGRYKTDSSVGSAYSQKHDPKTIEADHFSILLAKELTNGWNKKKYKKLVVVAPANFYSLMSKHMLDNILSDVTHIAKDYTKYDLQRLITSLQKHLFI